MFPDAPEFMRELLARLPDAIRDTTREPHTYAGYRDSLTLFLDMVKHVCNDATDLEPEATPAFYLAASAALELLLSRPSAIPLPHIDVRSNGKIEFEWYENPRKLVTLTVDQHRKIVFAALIGEDRVGDKAWIASEWPSDLVSAIKRVTA